MIFRLNGVTKEYSGHRALSDLTVDVQPGCIGLLGPNGAGKSTMIKTLLGLVRLTAGNAEVLGLDVRTQPIEIRERVGYMPEDDCYIAGLKGIEMVARAGELAGIPKRTALRRGHEMLDYVRLGDARYREVQTYSTGMKARVKLATALVHSPELVFLDEPTSGMDPDGREQMLALIRSLATEKGVSVVISTHILHDVEECCDSVLIVGSGKLLRYEKLEVLKQRTDNTTTVRVGSGADQLAGALQAKGMQTELDRRGVVSVTGNGDVPTTVLATIRECGLALRELTPAQNSLQDIFLQALRSGNQAPSNGATLEAAGGLDADS